MNSRFNQNKTEFSIFIFTISLQMFSHCNSLMQLVQMTYNVG